MNYIVSFYQPGNPQNIPSVWPCEIKPINLGDFTSDYINSHKDEFGISESQTYMTQDEYEAYRNFHYPTYLAWQDSVKNPEIKEEKIRQIKQECQRRIVAPLGYGPEQTTEFLARQINLNGRASEIILGIILGTATDAEKLELQKMKNFFGQVKAIRSFSNELETRISNGEEIDINSAEWPPVVL